MKRMEKQIPFMFTDEDNITHSLTSLAQSLLQVFKESFWVYSDYLAARSLKIPSLATQHLFQSMT